MNNFLYFKMKNPIIFPEDCRLPDKQRKKLQEVIESFPMDITVLIPDLTLNIQN